MRVDRKEHRELHPFAKYCVLLALFPLVVLVQGTRQWCMHWNQVRLDG